MAPSSSSSASASADAATGSTGIDGLSSAPTNAPSSSAASSSSSSSPSPPLVMQLILPRSLPSQPGWSTGPLIAQGAHAACAILALTAEHAHTRQYLSPEGLQGGMHKVVLQWPGKEKKKKKGSGTGVGAEAGARQGVEEEEEQEEGLEELSARLSAARTEWEQRKRSRGQGHEEEGEEEEFPVHTMWIEQPDNIPTCIAIAPNRKPPALKKILNKCALFRG